MAYNATPPSGTEDRAWILAQSSHVELLAGDLAKAESYATDALGLFPDYHYGLAALAQVRLAQGRYAEAVILLRKRYEAAPHSESLFALAEAQELAGQHEEAQASFRKFETMPGGNRELISYYVDHTGDPAKALAIARREIAQRHDVFTLDSYAWALAANGDYAEANRQIQSALHVGVKDPAVLYHAGFIALHLHQNDQAEAYLKDAAARHSREAASLLAALRTALPAGER
jgi:tetratricopeptide (TPR) repeat protein